MYKSNIREEFHKLIDEFDDVNLLEEFYDIINNYHPQQKDLDIIDELSDAQIERIKRSLKQSKEGKVTPHNQVKKRFLK
jgi:F0F1-type ATP synthase delta subunit